MVAAVMYLYPPKKINYLYGYRTTRSMKSQEHWDFAQRFSAMQMIRGAVTLIIISLLGYWLPFDLNAQTIIGLSMVGIMVTWMFISTEKAIKKEFPQT